MKYTHSYAKNLLQEINANLREKVRLQPKNFVSRYLFNREGTEKRLCS